MKESPSPREATAILASAEARRASLAEHVAVPRLFFVPIGAAIAVQIGTTAAGVAGRGGSPGWLILAGFGALLVVSAVQLGRFRSLNGVWLGGLVSRVIGGTTSAASASYVAALGAALWAALSGVWWFVPLCAFAGGTAYALSGHRWMQAYRSQPATHSRGESVPWLAALVLLFAAGLALLITLR
jgi:hypothetical protein